MTLVLRYTVEAVASGVEFTVLLAWHSARHGGRAMVVVGIVLGESLIAWERLVGDPVASLLLSQ